MSLNWNFQRGGGLKPVKPSVVGSMDIFWNNTVGKYLTCTVIYVLANGNTDNNSCWEMQCSVH